jgi:hypothetical protein
MIDFVEAHRGAITINGPLVTTSDPKLTPQLNALLEKINDRQAKTRDIYQKAQSLVSGN